MRDSYTGGLRAKKSIRDDTWKLAAYRLASRLGKTVAEIQATVSIGELAGWWEFMLLEMDEAREDAEKKKELLEAQARELAARSAQEALRGRALRSPGKLIT